MRLLVLALAGVSLRALALERELVVGSEGPAPWAELEDTSGTTTEAGWRGLPDIVVEDARYAPDPATELLLHFDTVPPSDAAGRYSVARPGSARLSSRLRVFGRGSAAFDGGAALALEPLQGASTEGLVGTGDFTIEFWLSPLHLEDGETVLDWEARGARDRSIRSQSILCRVRGRRLEWTLDGLFAGRAAVSLRGLTPLLPGRWAHHLLRCDADSGLMEYLVDGVLEAVAYATSSGRDGSAPLARTGSPAAGPGSGPAGRLFLGEKLTGLLDEMRVSHRFVERPQLARYGTAAARVITRPLDLGHPGSRLLRIDMVAATPAASAIRLAYRIAEEPFFGSDAGWKPLLPSQPLDSDARGRFVQVRADLMSDGSVSPALSRLAVVYEPNFPPPPPARVAAVAGDASITLSWQRVYEDDVRGYLVYYGTQPGAYSGTDSAAGPSPVDAGDAVSLTLTGLTNGRLYYLSVVSYDQAYPRHQSRFSSEVTARPSPLAGRQGPAGEAAAPAAGGGGLR